MSHPVKGPKHRLGIDGKASAANRRRALACLPTCPREAAP
jgi:hypothetical protein